VGTVWQRPVVAAKLENLWIASMADVEVSGEANGDDHLYDPIVGDWAYLLKPWLVLAARPEGWAWKFHPHQILVNMTYDPVPPTPPDIQWLGNIKLDLEFGSAEEDVLVQFNNFFQQYDDVWDGLRGTGMGLVNDGNLVEGIATRARLKMYVWGGNSGTGGDHTYSAKLGKHDNLMLRFFPTWSSSYSALGTLWRGLA